MEENQTNDVVIFDEGIICVEVLFKDGDIPYDTYKLGSIKTLRETLSDEFLEKERKRNNALSAVVQNIYCRAKMKGGQQQMEFRVGDRSNMDIEAITYKDGV